MPEKREERSRREDRRIVVAENGPYHVFGSLPLAKETIVTDSEGVPSQVAQRASLPRSGEV